MGQKFSCIIVEDEPLARNLITSYVSKLPRLELLGSFSNGLEALNYLHDHQVDILFSDIQMPEITGIGLLKLLKNKPIVILTTAYSEYALEGYELEVFDYLVKPISFERFVNSVEKAVRRLESLIVGTENTQIVTTEISEAKPDFIFVKDGTKLIKVNFKDILYFEGLKDYVCVYTTERKIVSLLTMKSLENTLPSDQFIRIHNSFIVSVKSITEIEKDRVLIGKNLLPISDSYKKTFKEFIESRQM